MTTSRLFRTLRAWSLDPASTKVMGRVESGPAILEDIKTIYRSKGRTLVTTENGGKYVLWPEFELTSNKALEFKK